VKSVIGGKKRKEKDRKANNKGSREKEAWLQGNREGGRRRKKKRRKKGERRKI